MARLSGFLLKGGVNKTLLDLVHPVNSLYLTVGSENPADVLGGVWAKLTGGVLACAGTAGYAAAGSSGGSKKISVSQMPSHAHDLLYAHNNGNISHWGIDYINSSSDSAWQGSAMAATGGGRTIIRSTYPSTSGRGRHSAGGFPWLGFASETARSSRSTARTLLARTSIALSTLIRSGLARLGFSKRKATTSSRLAAPTCRGSRTAATPTPSASTRCRATAMASTTSSAPAGMARSRRAISCSTSRSRWAVTRASSSASRRPVVLPRITTCRSQSPSLFGFGLNSAFGEVASHVAR